MHLPGRHTSLRLFLLTLVPALCAGFFLIAIPLSHAQSLQAVCKSIESGNPPSGITQTVMNGIETEMQSLSQVLTNLGTAVNTASAGPSISGIQGYNPGTGVYTANTVPAGDYLVLYGTFNASGDVIAIDGETVAPSYESTNQLNVPITSIAPGIHIVSVITSSGATRPMLFAVGAAASPTPSTPGASTITFPATILVTVPSLNVRSAPNTTASLAGSGTLFRGNTFTATNEVVGQTVEGTNLWWVSSQGNYVWSGGTEVESWAAAPASTNASAPVLSGVQGYNPSAKVYTTASAVVNTTLVLYGNFAPTNNGVTIDADILGVHIGTIAPTYESSQQIDVSLAGIALGNHVVRVTDTSGTSAPVSFTVVPAPTGSGTTGAVGGGSSSVIINYCSNNSSNIYCGAWLYCVTYPSDPACISINNSCDSDPTNPSCPTSIPPGTSTATPPAGSSASVTLAQVCATDPQFPDCATYCQSNPGAAGCTQTSNGSGSCTSGTEQECESAPNGCGQALSGTQTCAGGEWGACLTAGGTSVSTPSNNSCASFCAESPEDPDCVTYCQNNPGVPGCTQASGGSGGGSCTSGSEQECQSGANACGQTIAGSQTCAGGEWGTCLTAGGTSASTPSDDSCSSFCAESPDDPDCVTYCANNPGVSGCAAIDDSLIPSALYTCAEDFGGCEEVTNGMDIQGAMYTTPDCDDLCTVNN